MVREAMAAAVLLAVSRVCESRPDVTVSVYQTPQRHAAGQDRDQVHNTTSEPLTVEQAQLRSTDSSPKRPGTGRSISRPVQRSTSKMQMPPPHACPILKTRSW